MPSALSSYDHFAMAFVAFVGTFLASAVVLWLAERSKFHAISVSFRGITPPFLNVVGVLFALNLAFLANDTWSAHDRARDAVFQEAGALRSLTVEARQLPPALRLPMLEAIQHYATQAAGKEWVSLANRSGNAQAGADLDVLQGLVVSPEVAASLGGPVQGQMLQQMTQIRASHDLRIALSQTHVNPLKWLGMAFLGFLTVVSIVMVHVENARAAFMAVLIFAAASAPSAALVLVQGNPFQEPLGVSAAPLLGLLDGR